MTTTPDNPIRPGEWFRKHNNGNHPLSNPILAIGLDPSDDLVGMTADGSIFDSCRSPSNRYLVRCEPPAVMSKETRAMYNAFKSLHVEGHGSALGHTDADEDHYALGVHGAKRADLFDRTLKERDRQDEKWGTDFGNRHPGRWLGILMEEVAEVAAEIDLELSLTVSTESLVNELIQVAAVALSWAEHATCDTFEHDTYDSYISDIAKMEDQARLIAELDESAPEPDPGPRFVVKPHDDNVWRHGIIDSHGPFTLPIVDGMFKPIADRLCAALNTADADVPGRPLVSLVGLIARTLDNDAA